MNRSPKLRGTLPLASSISVSSPGFSIRTGFPPLGFHRWPGYIGYTQTSIWNLGADSAPFRDTSYRSSLFRQRTALGESLMPDSLRTGFSDGRALIVTSKVYDYLNREDNPDIRGYTDWNLRYGREGGGFLRSNCTTLPPHGSTRFDLSCLHLQPFKGYGESLLDYNLVRGTQVKMGFLIVR
jgi:outer membrane phospholipase A